MTDPKMEVVGRVSGFFAKPSVAVVKLSAPLKVGDTVYLKGHTTDFQQTVDSMQIEHQPVQDATGGDTVGLKVIARCRKRDTIYVLA